MPTTYTIIFEEAGQRKSHRNLSEDEYHRLLRVMLKQEGVEIVDIEQVITKESKEGGHRRGVER